MILIKWTLLILVQQIFVLHHAIHAAILPCKNKIPTTSKWTKWICLSISVLCVNLVFERQLQIGGKTTIFCRISVPARILT